MQSMVTRIEDLKGSLIPAAAKWLTTSCLYSSRSKPRYGSSRSTPITWRTPTFKPCTLSNLLICDASATLSATPTNIAPELFGPIFKIAQVVSTSLSNSPGLNSRFASSVHRPCLHSYADVSTFDRRSAFSKEIVSPNPCWAIPGDRSSKYP